MEHTLVLTSDEIIILAACVEKALPVIQSDIDDIEREYGALDIYDLNEKGRFYVEMQSHMVNMNEKLQSILKCLP